MPVAVRRLATAYEPWGIQVPSTEQILDVVAGIQERADRLPDEQVLATYYDFRAIRTALFSATNGVIFGRRGTGKSHALRYLHKKRAAAGDLVISIDLGADIGTTGSRYSDASLSLVERATRLVIDIAAILHHRLLKEMQAGRATPFPEHLNELASALSEVVVTESVELESEEQQLQSSSSAVSAQAGLDYLSGGLSRSDTGESSERTRRLERGRPAHRIEFGRFTRALKELLDAHDAQRVWMLFDEWTEVPIELQPYVAEMLRILFFRNPKVTVRIAAIAHRAQWRVPRASGGYLGLEIGAELFQIFDLDDHAVFPGATRADQTERSKEFFRAVVFRHINTALRESSLEPIDTEERMVSLLFTQTTALRELAMAAEGVPRDAVQILKTAAGLVPEGGQISTEHIRRAAQSIFATTKEPHLNGVPFARDLVDKIKADVLGSRRARAFLLSQAQSGHPLIQGLIDDRLLHLVRRGYSSRSAPGTRYDVIEIDYGFYVDLLGTGASPTALLGGDDDDAVMN